MITLRNELQINRRPADVFDFVANVENAPKWQPAVIATRRVTDGPIRVGTQFHEVARMMGKRIETVCEITELVPSRTLAFRATSSGPFSYQTSYQFEERNGATHLTIVGSFTFKGFWRLLEPVLKGELRKESNGELQAMKAAIESRH